MPRPTHTDQKLLKIVGGRIRAVREKTGLTQEKLAEVLNVGPDTVSRYETGSIPVSLTMLVKISEALKIEAACFFPQQNKEFEDDEQEIVAIWRMLDQGSRQVFLQFLRTFAK